MNGDLISREAVMDRIKTYFCACCYVQDLKKIYRSYETCAGCKVSNCLELIEAFPAVDAEPAAVGAQKAQMSAWVEIAPKGWGREGLYCTPKIACAKCKTIPRPYKEVERSMEGRIEMYTWIKTKNCPNCGAKMHDVMED